VIVSSAAAVHAQYIVKRLETRCWSTNPWVVSCIPLVAAMHCADDLAHTCSCVTAQQCSRVLSCRAYRGGSCTFASSTAAGQLSNTLWSANMQPCYAAGLHMVHQNKTSGGASTCFSAVICSTGFICNQSYGRLVSSCHLCTSLNRTRHCLTQLTLCRDLFLQAVYEKLISSCPLCSTSLSTTLDTT
jgi:hypothetical protein